MIINKKLFTISLLFDLFMTFKIYLNKHFGLWFYDFID